MKLLDKIFAFISNVFGSLERLLSACTFLLALFVLQLVQLLLAVVVGGAETGKIAIHLFFLLLKELPFFLQFFVLLGCVSFGLVEVAQFGFELQILGKFEKMKIKNYI